MVLMECTYARDNGVIAKYIVPMNMVAHLTQEMSDDGERYTMTTVGGLNLPLGKGDFTQLEKLLRKSDGDKLPKKRKEKE